MWANAASGLPHLQHVSFGVASRGFKGFQGSLLYTCSVISWSLRIKRFAIANHCGFLHGYIAVLPFVCREKAFCYDMTSRPTRNSQAAAFDAMISPAESNPSSSVANSSLPSTGSADPSATPQSSMSDQPSPAFLAAVVSAVKQALAAEQTSNLPSTPATSFASSVPMAASPGGVPGSSSSSSSTGHLDAQASSLAASGVGFRRSHRLFPLPRSKVGLILLYLLLLLHLPHR